MKTQLVEYSLTMVMVTGSNPVFRFLKNNGYNELRTLLFFFTSSFALISAIMVISLDTALHSILFLITFFVMK
jgi:hypothetical protein